MWWYFAQAGAKVALTGGVFATFAGRRALWPGFIVGSAFSGAAWFGVFEMTWSFNKLLMPIPAEPDEYGRSTGLMTLPITIGSSMWMGWKVCPEMAPPPNSMIDISGLLSYVRSVPVKHFAIVGGSSAALAATTCRIVQYRGGA